MRAPHVENELAQMPARYRKAASRRRLALEAVMV